MRCTNAAAIRALSSAGRSRSSASGQPLRPERSFVAEACEFDRSFHHLRPKVALLTNIEEDHLDCYKDIYEIIESFRVFANLVPENGLIIANGRDAHVALATKDARAQVETVSLTPGTTWSVCPTGIVDGCHTGRSRYDGKPVATLRLSVAGEHNLFNATMAVAACAASGVEPARAAEALKGFTGVDRRMTVVGQANGATSSTTTAIIPPRSARRSPRFASGLIQSG